MRPLDPDCLLPEEATSERVDSAATGCLPSPDGQLASMGWFVKRRDLVDQLGHDVETALASAVGLCVRLIGEAGIGKSTIVEELASRAAQSGVNVWLGAANELERARPLAALSGVVAQGGGGATVESLLGDLPSRRRPAQLGAGGLISGAEVGRLVELDEVVDAVEQRAQEPTVLIVEDVHWADAVSLEALVACALVTTTHPLCLVITQRAERSDAAMDMLDHGLAAAGCHDVIVEPLSEAEVGTLLQHLCGGLPSQALVTRSAGAAGNPFLLREYVDGLLADGDLTVADDEIDIGTPGIPSTLRAAIRRNLARLGDDVSAMLRAAAVHGRIVNVTNVGAMLERTPISLAEPIEIAVRSGLLEEHGAVLRFRHDLVRLAVYEEMPVSSRMAAHRQLAAVLARQAAPAAIVGSHLVLGVDNGDAEVIDRLREAAEEVAPVDPATALSFLARARVFAQGDVETLRVIEWARLEALTGAGRIAEAETVARWLLDVVPPERRAELWRRIGGLATLEGNAARALQYLERAADEEMSDAERSRLLAMTSMTSALAVDYGRAWTAAEGAIELGDRIDEPTARSAGRALIARMSTFANAIDEGLKQGAVAVAIAETDSTGYSHSFVPCLHYGMTAFDADRFDIAAEMVARGFEVADTHQLMWSRPLFGALAAGLHYRRGDIDRALAEAETAVELAHKTSSLQTLTWATAVALLVSCDLGDVDRAVHWQGHLDAAEANGQSGMGIDHAALARGRLLLLTGDVDGALAGLVESWDVFDQLGLAFCQPLIGPDIGRLAHGAGDVGLLDRTATGMAVAAAASGVPSIAAHAELLRALRDDDAGLARRSITRLDRTGRDLDAAIWRVEFPDLVGTDAVAEMRRALSTYQRVGASGAAARVRQLLTERGNDSEPPEDGWGALTRTETAITELLARGLTNAQIARERGSSRRTVESHLGRVYQKLAIEGRVALTVAAAEHFRAE